MPVDCEKLIAQSLGGGVHTAQRVLATPILHIGRASCGGVYIADGVSPFTLEDGADMFMCCPEASSRRGVHRCRASGPRGASGCPRWSSSGDRSVLGILSMRCDRPESLWIRPTVIGPAFEQGGY